MTEWQPWNSDLDDYDLSMTRRKDTPEYKNLLVTSIYLLSDLSGSHWAWYDRYSQFWTVLNGWQWKQGDCFLFLSPHVVFRYPPSTSLDWSPLPGPRLPCLLTSRDTKNFFTPIPHWVWRIMTIHEYTYHNSILYPMPQRYRESRVFRLKQSDISPIQSFLYSWVMKDAIFEAR